MEYFKPTGKIFQIYVPLLGCKACKNVFLRQSNRIDPSVFSGDSDVGDFMMVTDLRCW